MGDLKDWANENWVDIGAPKKDGKYQPCGRKNAKTSKRKYPKCVPAAKAAGMSKSQKASAVSRKRAKAQGVGGKPTMVKTKGGGMAKKKFPDLSGDGKVTQKDVLMGRGVVQKALAGKLITGAAKTIAKKNKKGFSEADLRRFEKETKADMKKFNIKPKAQTLTKKEKIILPAAKITAPIGIAAGVYGLNETYKGMKSTIKGADKARNPTKPTKPSKTKRKEKKNISQADIIGKGSKKGRRAGGIMGDVAGSVASKMKAKKMAGEDRVTLQDIEEAFKRSHDKSSLNKRAAKALKQLSKGIGKGAKKAGKAIPVEKVKKKMGGGMANKYDHGGTNTKGQGAAVRGTKFKGTF